MIIPPVNEANTCLPLRPNSGEDKDYYSVKPNINKPVYTVLIQNGDDTQKVYMDEEQYKKYEEQNKQKEAEKQKQRALIKEQEWLAFINKPIVYTSQK